MGRRLRRIGLCSALGWVLFAAAPACAADPAGTEALACRNLATGSPIGTSTVVAAELITDGRNLPALGKSGGGLPTFCRVAALATPSAQSHIVVEVWLPTRDAWNGKFLGTGNGGFGGEIIYPSLAGGVRRGFATANTDLGTHPAGLAGVGYAAGNGRPETVKDWGFRATHEMAVFGKEIARRFYGSHARRSLFVGCSTGGHQGLTEAQRFPEDFDGIIAGAPGHNRTHLHAMFTSWSILLRQLGREAPTLKTTGLWRSAQLATCLTKQGGAPGDTYLPNPGSCRLRPVDLLCRPGQVAGCLAQAQVDALDIYLTGTRNPRTGALIYPAMTYAMVGAVRSPTASAGLPVASELTRWVFGPQWDPESFDFDRDMDRVDRALADDINANNPDISRFAARGGKLLMFHGWDDPIVSPFDSILYFDRAFATGTRKEDFLKLFMVPGMGHCAGGPGATVFGQDPAHPAGSATDDLIAALDRWVEAGEAPTRLTARRLATGLHDAAERKPPIAERPICSYPWGARYIGQGSATEAGSFACRKAPPLRFESPAPEYLK